jgi:hypothetical protein
MAPRICARISIRRVVPAGALRGITEAFSASYNLLAPEEQYAVLMVRETDIAPGGSTIVAHLFQHPCLRQ